MKITILGCGNSAGTPHIGNNWGKCDPDNPKNRRSRCSIAVQTEKTTIIVDTGPDFREQLNREEITAVDHVLYTHPHGDHLHGIDDLRVFRNKTEKQIPIYGNKDTIEEIRHRFAYLFREGHNGIYPKVVSEQVIEENNYLKPFNLGDIEIVPFEQDHGTCLSLGYRFGDDFGYSVDMVRMDENAANALKGIKTWIVDSAGYKFDNPYVHASLETIYKLNEIIGAEQVYLTSMTINMDYQSLYDELPEGYLPAYDGLTCQL